MTDLQSDPLILQPTPLITELEAMARQLAPRLVEPSRLSPLTLAALSGVLLFIEAAREMEQRAKAPVEAADVVLEMSEPLRAFVEKLLGLDAFHPDGTESRLLRTAFSAITALSAIRQDNPDLVSDMLEEIGLCSNELAAK